MCICIAKIPPKTFIGINLEKEKNVKASPKKGVLIEQGQILSIRCAKGITDGQMDEWTDGHTLLYRS